MSVVRAEDELGRRDDDEAVVFLLRRGEEDPELDLDGPVDRGDL